jgi:F0F1-type ATP synthase assembly protein I
MKLSGLGVELVGAVGGFTLMGWLWDRYHETSPWGVVIGAVLGLVGGMYNLIRQALNASKEAGIKDKNGAAQ